jgi:hypothetical protein
VADPIRERSLPASGPFTVTQVKEVVVAIRLAALTGSDCMIVCSLRSTSPSVAGQ